MRLSVSTLGCPDWDLPTIVERVSAYGYDAVDFRCCGGSMELDRLPEFNERAEETRERLASARLVISAFSSPARVFPDPAKAVADVRAYAALCRTFGVPHIRVFGGDVGAMPRSEAIRTVAATLREAARIAADHGAQVLLETHDSFTASADLRAVMEAADHPAAGIVWDFHHPWRVHGEQPEATWATMGPWVRNVHVKDARADGAGKSRLCLTGDGVVPVRECVSVLRRNGYAGPYTYEWEKRWHPEIEEPDIAFPHYVRYMNHFGHGRD